MLNTLKYTFNLTPYNTQKKGEGEKKEQSRDLHNDICSG